MDECLVFETLRTSIFRMISLMGRKSHGLSHGLKVLWWSLNLPLSGISFPTVLLVQSCRAAGGEAMGKEERVWQGKNV